MGSKYRLELGTRCAVNSSFGKASHMAASAVSASTARTCGLQFVAVSTQYGVRVHVDERTISLRAVHAGCACSRSPATTAARARRRLCSRGVHPPPAQSCQVPARTSQQRRRLLCRLSRPCRDHDRKQNLKNHVGRTRIFCLNDLPRRASELRPLSPSLQRSFAFSKALLEFSANVALTYAKWYTKYMLTISSQ